MKKLLLIIRVKFKYMWHQFLRLLLHVFRQFDDPYYTGVAAQIAYFFFMSSVPIIIVLTQMLGIFNISMDYITAWLDRYLTANLNSFLKGLFSASSAPLTNIVLIVSAVWASSSLAFSLSRLTSYTISDGKYKFNFFVERLKSVFTALVSIVTIALAVVVYVWGEIFAKQVFHSPLMARIIEGIKGPLLLLFFFTVILINYYLLPKIKLPFRAILPGAVFSTVGIMIMTWAYSLYISHSTTYNILYGAFTNVVVLMLWLYFISLILCVGMMFNKSWDVIMNRGRLTDEKLIEYLRDKIEPDEDIRKYFALEDDIYYSSYETLAVKLSRRLDKDYNDEREKALAQSKQEDRIRNRLKKWLR